MVNYSFAKIYKIEPKCPHEEGEIYIGSTAQEVLCLRYRGHKNVYKSKKGTVSVHALFDKYGVKNCDIVLLELCPCKTRDELFARESYYIQTMKCVNKNIMGRNRQEYRDSHKVEIALYNKNYLLEHREEILQSKRDYHHEHREDILQKKRNYNHEHKEEINAKNKIYREKNQSNK